MAEKFNHTLPKSPMGEALQYTIPRWDNLLAYLYGGHLEIDNNLVENAIRPNALGRKNYLFAGSHEGLNGQPCFTRFLVLAKRMMSTPLSG
ncbi:transposase [Maribellus comscasis]|uniref:Transposase n=1 Tax=Maribellus comscasis TaxID=2681766 RepID=A0A6I6K513_9BACT|nr:transposase [Maribellus comscasis]QGY47502.1 transposase [Maribellus comscasis]